MKPLLKDFLTPNGVIESPLKALLVDSWYDSYLGVVVLVRIIDGTVKKGQKIKLMSNSAVYQVDRVGIYGPNQTLTEELSAGQIGFITASIKEVADTRVGDTVTDDKNPCETALDGFKPSQPVVFCGLFPLDSSEFDNLRDAMEKLRLNDSSFVFEMETSAALGLGFRCGFLGLLHLEVICERVDREYGIELITTAPSVIYKIHTTDNKLLDLHNPVDLPETEKINFIEEPWISATILVPDDYLGAILKLCEERRGFK